MSSHSAAAAPSSYSRSDNVTAILGVSWLALPAVFAILSVTSGNTMYLWIFPSIWFVFVPLADALMRPVSSAPDRTGERHQNDSGRPQALESLMVPLAYADVLVIAWLVAESALPWHAVIAAGLSLGLVFATVVVNSRLFGGPDDRSGALLSFFATALIGYGHYRRVNCVDHQRGCATPGDPLSARMGENFWKFLLRGSYGAIRQVWQVENDHRDTKNRVFDALRSPIVAGSALMLGFYAVLVAVTGASMAILLAIAWLTAVTMVAAIHYIQHYGLLRDKRRDGEYVRVGPTHAWDDAHAVSGMLLLNATRHANSHTQPLRPCGELRCLDDAPKLPVGYAGATMLAMIPRAWFRVMDHRVALWANGDMRRVNIDGAAYATLMAQYHRPTSA